MQALKPKKTSPNRHFVDLGMRLLLHLQKIAPRFTKAHKKVPHMHVYKYPAALIAIFAALVFGHSLSATEFFDPLAEFENTGSSASHPKIDFPFMPSSSAGRRAAGHEQLLYNCIDPISGSFLDHEIDCSIPSPLPIELQHSYSSKTAEVLFLPHCSLLIGSETKQLTSTCQGIDMVIGISHEPNGIATIYSGPRSTLHSKKPIKPKPTNCIFSNNQLFYNKDTYQIISSSGVVRTYEKNPSSGCGRLVASTAHAALIATLKEVTLFRLTSELYPNGNRLLYEYDPEGQLQAIKAVGVVNEPNNEFGSVECSYAPNKITLKTSHGHTVTYEFNAALQLVRVVRSCKPTIEYQYKNELLIKKSYPGKKNLNIQYSEQKKVISVLPGGVQSPLYRLEYKTQKTPQETHVTDALGNKVVYEHAGDMLHAIYYYGSDGAPLKAETFRWGKKTKAGLLVEHQIKPSKEAEALVIKEYLHDHYGNTIQESFNATQRSSEYTFSDDRFHNVEKEITPYGATILYTYKPETNLCIKKLTTYHNKIRMRAFYFYDENAQLIHAVIDDGKDPDYVSLDGVSERHIKHISYEDTKRTIQELYLNPESKKEVLLREYCYECNKEGQITSCTIKDATGAPLKTERYEYDAHGNRTKHIDALGNPTLMFYDENDTLIRKEEPKKELSTMFRSDACGRIISVTERFQQKMSVSTLTEYDVMGNHIASIDTYGNKTTYEYDALGNCLRITLPEVLDQTGNPLSPTWQYSYDCVGNTTQQHSPQGHITEYCYNAKGDITTVSYPDGTKQSYVWSDRGALVQKRNRDGTGSCYEHDYAGRITYEGSLYRESDIPYAHAFYSYSAFHLLSSCDYESNYTFFLYNSAGKLIRRTQPPHLIGDETSDNAAREEYSYDALGRRVRTKKRIHKNESYTEVVTYDLLDRVITTFIEQPDKTNLQRRSSEYDAFGNIAVKKVGNFEEKCTYFQGRLPQCIQDLDGSITTYEYGKAQTNDQGNILWETEIHRPDNTTLHVLHDACSRDVGYIVTDENGAIISEVRRFFNPVGQLARIEDVHNKKILAEYSHGVMGRLEKDMACEYSYNAYGQVKLITSDKGKGEKKYRYEYDSMGRLVLVYMQTDTEREHLEKSFQYDLNNRIVAACSCDGIKTSRSYNHLGLITEETIDDSYGSYTMRYEYDLTGRMKKLVLPDGSIIEYTYNGSVPKQVIRKAKDGSEAYMHQFLAYNAQGLVTEERSIFASDTIRTEYTPSGRIQRIDSTFLQQEATLDTSSAHVSRQRGVQKSVQKYDGLDRCMQIHEASTVKRLFYVGAQEIGCLDNKNQILELKVPKHIRSDGIEGAVAIEHNHFAYLPLSDAQGNIACLVDVQSRMEIIEKYTYDLAGSVQIVDADGNEIEAEEAENPWHWQARRAQRY